MNAPVDGPLNNPEPEPHMQRMGVIPSLDTNKFNAMLGIAKVMAQGSLCPKHLTHERIKKGDNVEWKAFTKEQAEANCFMVVNQAVAWHTDPFQVAQSTYVTSGRIGYEGKLLAAVINMHPKMARDLKYQLEGPLGTDQRKVTVVGYLKGEGDEPRTIDGTVGDWKTNNGPWRLSQYDQQLCYRGAREWARRHLPQAIFGILADDEVEQIAAEETGAVIDNVIPMPKAIAPDAGNGEPSPLNASVQGTQRAGETVDRETGEVDPPQQQAQQQQHTNGNGNGSSPRANEGMLKHLRLKIKNAIDALGENALTEADVCRKMQIASFEQFTYADVNAAMKLVERQAETA
jgi:hypothetical protein